MEHVTTKVAMRYKHPSPEHKLYAVKSLDKLDGDAFFPKKNLTAVKWKINFKRIFKGFYDFTDIYLLDKLKIIML